MTKEAYKSGRIRFAARDGNREFISLLACVCADGTSIPPALIYQGASGDLQNTWMHDLNEGEEAYFASAANGWSSDAFGLAWLNRFHENTRHKNSRRRLLIVDGHSSHVNWAFISAAEELRILLLILPPHTTHRLQPLDVSLFSPLSQAYSSEMQEYTYGGQGWVSMTKRMFWTLFKKAWRTSFTDKNIKKAFECTGIWPYNTQKTVKKLQIPDPTPITPALAPNGAVRTLLDCRDLRRFGNLSPSLQNVARMQEIAMVFATKFELAQHENGQLKAALFHEKQRRQRSKHLNLVGEEYTGAAQFYSPTRVLAAKEYQESKEAVEQEEIRQKALRKAEKERERVQKLAEKEEAKLQKEMAQALKKEQKEAKRAAIEQRKIDRQLAKQARELVDAEKKLGAVKKKEAAAAAAIAAAASGANKTVKKAASKGPKKAAKKVANLSKKVVVQSIKSKAAAEAKKGLTPDPPATSTLAAATGTSIRSRSGRTLTRPSRFKD